MSNKETGGFAFPRKLPTGEFPPMECLRIIEDHAGMTLRQYAAIKLKVPDSGEDWLDAMILAALRNDFAAKAMQAMITKGMDDFGMRNAKGVHFISKFSYEYADGMLEARK